MSRGSLKSCTCAACIQACVEMPGWMTPEEAECAIQAGYGSALMLDWLEPCDEIGNVDEILVLCPACAQCDGRRAPVMPPFPLNLSWVKGRCVLLTRDGRCEIHNSGFKPAQCRLSRRCHPSAKCTSNYTIARLWDTEDGRRIVAGWRERFYEKGRR